MTDPLNDRFETVARAKLATLVDIYHRLPADISGADDKAIYQRQSAGKALLAHIAMLRKLLGLDAVPVAAHSDALDVDRYRAMVAALGEVGADG